MGQYLWPTILLFTQHQEGFDPQMRTVDQRHCEHSE